MKRSGLEWVLRLAREPGPSVSRSYARYKRPLHGRLPASYCAIAATTAADAGDASSVSSGGLGQATANLRA